MTFNKTNALQLQTAEATDAYITDLAQRRMNEAATLHPSYAALWQRILDITVGGGKRFRPYLTMVGYGEFSEEVLPIAVAQELIHSAMLVHDDIIDRDTIRRGKKNISGLYVENYGKYLGQAEARHYADSAAIIAGDALISEAYLCVAATSFNETVKRALIDRLHRSVYEAVGGELMDIEAAFVNDMKYDAIPVYRYKTGYSFIGPLLSGALCAGESQEVIAALERYGAALSVAFQLQDDLLGVFGDESETGKSTLTDIQEGKATYLIAAHTPTLIAGTEQAERFSKLFGNTSSTQEEIALLRRDLEESGAKEKTEALCEYHYASAQDALMSLDDGPRKSELTSLIEILKERKC